MSGAGKHFSSVMKLLLKLGRRLNVVLYPELARLGTEQAQDEAMVAVAARHSRKWHYPVSIVVAPIGGLALGVLATLSLQRLGLCSFVPEVLVRTVAILSGLATGVIVLGCIYRNRNRRELRQLLAERCVAICRACGYDLTGNKSGRCPECGRAVSGNAARE